MTDWTPDWRAVGDGSFQKLVNDLLSAELGKAGRYEPFTLPQDGGFDGRFDGVLDGMKGSFRVQATYSSPDRQPKSALSDLRKKVRKEGKRKGAGTHLLFVTSFQLRERQLASLERAGYEAGTPTIVWGRDRLEQLLRRHLDVAARHFGDVAFPSFVTLEDWRTEPADQRPPLAAPLAELVDDLSTRLLGAARAGHSSVTLLTGPPGSGRTRTAW